MPSYPFLFEVKQKTDAGDLEVKLPQGYAPPGQVIIANQNAKDLVAYLKSLNHIYPVVEKTAAER
jgi:cytochrome c oxidase cbb3-type subunit 2